MLDRYRKSGGFNQLLGLLETCGAVKQEKFLQIIREQDAAWAEAIELRVLTITRIFSWKDTAVAELVPGLPELTIATALHGLDESQREIFMRTMSFSQQRNIRDLFSSSKPTRAEVNATLQKILTETRRLITEGRLRLSEIDPELVVPDDIEERLKKGPMKPRTKAELAAMAAAAASGSCTSSFGNPSSSSFGTGSSGEEDFAEVSETTSLNFDLARNIGSHVSSVMAEAPKSESITRAEASLRDENMALRRKLTAMTNENSTLKQDISRLQMKIDQIRKMAA